MAKTLYEIRMNFRVANEMADRLQALAARLGNIANDQFYGTLRGISNNWKGENAEAYTRKGERLRGKMTGTANDLNKAADTIRTIARNTYNAEMRAWRIAQTRNSS